MTGDTMTWCDPHLHFFALEQGDYHWLQANHPPFWPDKADIAQPFLPEHIVQDHHPCRFVHIEAGFDNAAPWREVAWLEAHVDTLKQHGADIDFRTIACCDLTLPLSTCNAQLEQLIAYNSVVGVRHILDDAAEHLLQQPSVRDNLASVWGHNLIFELQCDCGDQRVVDALVSLLDGSTNGKLVINHCGGSAFADNRATEQQWQQLARLAQYPHIYIKASGWEMVDRGFSWNKVEQVVKRLVGIWGEDRVMLASNAPLLHWRMGYHEYWDTLVKRNGIHPKLLAENAFDIYFK